jgi:predicted transcriptional regulator
MTLIELDRSKPERRDKLVIMTEIIGIAIEGASKTQIMYKANLSFSQLKRYLTLLSHHCLLKKSAYAGREIYKATPKGVEFIEIQRQLIGLISEKRPRNGVKPGPFDRKVSEWFVFSNRHKCYLTT